MSEIEDLTGLKINSLLVVGFHHKKDGRYFWLCRCDCRRSEDFPIRSDALKNGTTKCCNTCGRERKGLASFVNLEGMTFGELLVLKRDKIKKKYCKENNVELLVIPYWEFHNIEKILEQTLFG